MKKTVYLLLLLLVLLLFVSCGSTVPDTTPAAVTTEEVSVTTTVPTTTTPTTTETPTKPVTPETTPEGIDILYGDKANCAIDPDGYKGHSILFEYAYGLFDDNMMIRVKMLESRNSIYEDLVITDFNTSLDDSVYQGKINPAYRLVVTVDGQDIEIKRSTAHSRKGDRGGYLYLDLGADFTYPADWEQKGGVDVWLRVYSVKTNEVVYYAWFTDDRYDGLYSSPPPVKENISF